jgi:hypothetical protein
MDKKNKGLVDRGDGDFILNESGTSVSVDNIESTPKERNDQPVKNNNEEEPFIPEVADEQKDNTD